MILGALLVLTVGPILFAGAALSVMSVTGGVLFAFELVAGLVLAGFAGFIL